MNILPIISLSILCFGMAVLYMFLGERNDWIGLFVRGLSLVSCIALVQVSASLKNLINALPLFVTLGLAVLVLNEALKFSDLEEEKAKIVILSILNSVGYVLIALGGMSLSEFNIFALLGGVAFGVAFGFITCAIKKCKSKSQIVLEIFTFTAIGFILGFGLMGVITSAHMLSSLCMLGGGAILLFQKLMYALGNGSKGIRRIANFLYILGLTIISLSVFLY